MKNKIFEFKKYLSDTEKSKNTIDKYVSDVNELYKWFRSCNLKKLSKEDILKYNEYLKSKHKDKVKSINSKISSLNAYFIDGQWYFFGENGKKLTNQTTPDGYTVNPDGSWKV